MQRKIYLEMTTNRVVPLITWVNAIHININKIIKKKKEEREKRTPY